jgi:hypothetical protein
MSIVLQGSTSGSITLQEPAVAGTTVLDLPAVSGTILTTGSSGQSIPKAALPTGSVLQVVSASTTTRTSTTSTSFVDCTNVTASITPTSSTSKILVLVTATGLLRPSNSGESVSLRLVRGSTTIFQQINLMYSASTNLDFVCSSNMVYLDSPATTSSTTYKLQFRSRLGTGTVYINQDNADDVSSITLMEIAA